MQQKTSGAIEGARARYPAVCYVFDCLHLDGQPLVSEPLVCRRVWLEDTLTKNTSYRISEVVAEGAELFRAA
jgi:ATP-dependent DNA ligase